MKPIDFLENCQALSFLGGPSTGSGYRRASCRHEAAHEPRQNCVYWRLRMRNIRFASGMLLAFLALADTYPRQPGIKIEHYTFDIALNDANDEFIVRSR